MTEVNSMYHAQTRSDALKAQIEKLEGLAHHTVVNPTFDQFDAETEDLLRTSKQSSVCGSVQICHRRRGRGIGQFAGIGARTFGARHPQEGTSATPSSAPRHSDRAAGTRSARG